MIDYYTYSDWELREANIEEDMLMEKRKTRKLLDRISMLEKELAQALALVDAQADLLAEQAETIAQLRIGIGGQNE